MCLPGERWLQVVGVLSVVAKDTMLALSRVVAKDTVSALVKPTKEIEEFSVDAVGCGMVPLSPRPADCGTPVSVPFQENAVCQVCVLSVV